MTIPKDFRPMLAINYEKVKTQPFVRYVSEKLDGVRVVFFGGVAYSRTLKPLPNKQIQKLAQQYSRVLNYCDGEVIYGDKYAVDVLQESTSFCMNANKQGDFSIWLFDKYHPTQHWIDRYSLMQDLYIQYPSLFPKEVHVLQHYYLVDENPREGEVILEEFEAKILALGGEGVMIRNAHGTYKFGRSATREPELQKVKKFNQEEFKVVGYSQLETNQNELERDERGYAKRSTSKDGKQLVEALGSLTLDLPDGKQFNAGSGFTAEQRLQFWNERDTLVGRLASIQFFGFSKDGYPLLPVFKAFRSEIDI